jgi:hypothetical protein
MNQVKLSAPNAVTLTAHHSFISNTTTHLVGVCEHIYALLRELDIRDPAQKARIDQVVLPFIERTINLR